MGHWVDILVLALCLFPMSSLQQLECNEKPIELREEMANVVLTGTINNIYRKPYTKMYSCEVRVVRVFKGDNMLNGNMKKHSPFSPATIMVDGFGAPQICENSVRKGDTRILLLERDQVGNLKLNSSVVRITMNNLDRAEAAVSDIPFATREPTTEGPCARKLCSFGAMCQVDEKGQGICICPEVCTDVFAPVCGSDSVTYISECHLRVASCSQKKRITMETQGPCGSSNPCATKECNFGAVCIVSTDGNSARCVCPSTCDGSGSPVCGDDGNDYTSECELRKMTCQKKIDVKLKFRGPCDPCVTLDCKKGTVCKLEDDRQPKCRCKDKCTEEIKPVCGSNGETYDNECLLHRQACVTGREIRVISDAACSPRNNPCTDVDCKFGSCEVNQNGETSCLCRIECADIYAPVCGSNDITYNNECELQKQKCEQKEDITKKKDGPCGDMTRKACKKFQCDYGATCALNERGEPYCDCELGCNDEYDPVCGSDGMTYSNICQLNVASCQQQKEILVIVETACNDCERIDCQFGSICDANGARGATCVCPNGCIQVYAPVCGSDGNTYNNECELKVQTCQMQKMIEVVAQGPCEPSDQSDLCTQVRCDYGAICDRGRCVCPLVCPMIYSPLCGSDEMTYSNECEMKVASCQEKRDIYIMSEGECESDEISGSGSGDMPDEEDSMEVGSGAMECDETTCRYGGACIYDVDDSVTCSCDMVCPALRSPVCGSDGITYSNDCELKLAMCQQQKWIGIETCEDVEMEPCDGELPLTDADTGKEYFCGEGPNHSECPAGSYCHIHPTGSFAKCCKEQIGQNCEDSMFGCCPDGKTPAQGINDAGCPSSCECNALGSYQLTCNPQTMQCSCKPGVGGLRCDRCEPGYWDFRGIQSGNSGCRPCSCSRGGSVRDDCEQMTGRCVCKDNVMGMKCDLCPSGQLMGPIGCRDVDEPTKETGTACHELVCSYGAICEIMADGTAQCSCPSLCPAIYTPVCGTDGQTYGNECQMLIFACRLQQNIQVVNTGPCETTLVTPTVPIGGCVMSRFGCCPDGVSVARGLDNEGCPDGSLACHSVPCQHGGTCLNIDAAPGYTCQCPAGKGGPVCADDVVFYLPSFAGSSYLAFGKMKGFFSVDIQMEFRTLTNDGLLLFNGQKEDGKGDFVSVAIRGGFVEFRYDLGSGTATLKSMVKLQMNQWHRVRASRNKRDGELSVDDEPDVTGVSAPRLSGLNVEQDLFIGSVPDAQEEVFGRVGVSGGFIGCLKSLRINGIRYDLEFPGPDVLYGKHVGECGENPCTAHPCKNGAECIALDAEMYKCICVDPYTGPVCGDTLVDPCDGNMCAEGSTCKGLTDGGYMCQCPLGFEGDMCQDEILVEGPFIPAFHGNSFIERPGLNGQYGQRIEIMTTFLTKSPNGMIFYNGQLTNGKGDFIALNLVNGFLEFRYDLGSGAAEIRSEDRVTLDEWHQVKVMRDGRDGEMVIDDLPPVTGHSQGRLGQLNLKENLFLGGTDDYSKFSRKAGITNGLVGAIQKFEVGEEKIVDLTGGAIRGVEITNYNEHACTNNPCQNDGICMPKGDSFECMCKMGYLGDTCEQMEIVMTEPPINIDGPVNFDGNSFYSYMNMINTEQRAQRSNDFELTFRTSEANGLLLWNGVAEGKMGDFISVAVTDGLVQFAFNLGSGAITITSEQIVNDNEWHTVSATRSLREGSLQVDGEDPVTLQAKRGTTQLDISGTLWIGGYNDPQEGLTGGFITNFEGCIKDVRIAGNSLHLVHNAKDRQPDSFCPDQ